MAKIPEYERSVGITDKGPAVEVDSRSYGVRGRAEAEFWGQVGKTAGKVSEVGFDINEQMIRAKTVDQFSNMNAAYTKGLYELREAVKGGTIERDGVTTNFSNDPSTWQANFEAEHAKLLEKTMGMGTIVGAQVAFKRHASMIFPTQLHGVMSESRKQDIENKKVNLDANLQIYQETLPMAKTELEKTQLWNNVNRSIEEAVKVHILTPKQGELIYKKFGKTASQNEFNRALELDAPGTRKILDHPGAFNMSDKERMEYAKPHADRIIHQNQASNYSKSLQQIVEAAYKGQPIPFTTDQVIDMAKAGHINPQGEKELLALVEGAKNNQDNKSDDPTKTRMWTVLTTGKIGDKSLDTAEGKALAWQMILNPQAKLKTEDRVAMMKDLRSQERGDEKALDKFVKNKVGEIRSVLKVKSKRIDGEFFSEYLKDKQENPAIYQDEEKAEERLMKLGDHYMKKSTMPSTVTPADERTLGEKMTPGFMGGKPAPGPIPNPAYNAKPFSTSTMTPEQARQKLRDKGYKISEPGSVPGRAAGGPVEEGQPYVVGERGPELMVPNSGGQPKMVGQGGAEVITPGQPGQIVPNDMLKSILQEYPGLQKVHSTDSTSVMFADEGRIAATKKAYGKDEIGHLEYWPKEESGMPGLPHPTDGKGNVLEIYNQDLKSDPKELHTAILGDLLHGMPKDPGWAKMRDEFAKNFSPAAKELIKKKDCPPEARDSMIDAFIRGAMMPYKGGNWKDQDPELYSKKQLELLDKMEKYLKAGE